jgi:hypothetical protein
MVTGRPAYCAIVTNPFSRCVALTLSLALLATSSGVAFADDDDGPTHKTGLFDGNLRQDGLGIEVGAIVQSGRTEFASNNLGLSPMSQGLVLRDRNGMSARMVIGLLIAVAGALGSSGVKSQSSRSYVQGDYVVTETTTTYYSEEEKRQMRENNAKAVAGVFSTKYSDMELQLYSKDRFGLGESSGYKVNFYIGAGDKFAFESGFGFGVVDSVVNNTGAPVKLTYKYLGMPFRVSTVYKNAVRIGLTYEWNWLKYGVEDTDRQLHTPVDSMGNPGPMEEARVTSHPWHLDLSTVMLKRVSLAGGITAQQIQKPNLGFFLQAGVMF